MSSSTGIWAIWPFLLSRPGVVSGSGALTTWSTFVSAETVSLTACSLLPESSFPLLALRTTGLAP